MIIIEALPHWIVAEIYFDKIWLEMCYCIAESALPSFEGGRLHQGIVLDAEWLH